MLKKLKVFFIHGKQGGLNWGRKSKYLRDRFKLHGIQMTSCKNADFEDPKVWETVLSDCVDKQKKELNRFDNDKFDFYIASSFGGAVLIEIMKEKGFLKYDKNIILLAPAQRDQDYDSFKNLKKFKSVLIIHGDKDKVVPFENSVKLSAYLGWELIRVDDCHSLKSIIHDQDGGLKYYMMKLLGCEDVEEGGDDEMIKKDDDL